MPFYSTTLLHHMKIRRETSRHKGGANRPSDTVLGFAYLRFAGVNGRSVHRAGSPPGARSGGSVYYPLGCAEGVGVWR